MRSRAIPPLLALFASMQVHAANWELLKDDGQAKTFIDRAGIASSDGGLGRHAWFRIFYYAGANLPGNAQQTPNPRGPSPKVSYLLMLMTFRCDERKADTLQVLYYGVADEIIGRWNSQPLIYGADTDVVPESTGEHYLAAACRDPLK